jgi:hypothetical protein
MAKLPPVRLIDAQRRAYAKEMIDRVPDGWVVALSEPTRTLDQNAMLWPLLTDLSRQVEWPINGVAQKLSPEDWKDLATASLAKEQRVAAGLDGGFVFLGRRTSTMSKRTFSDLIEIIFAFGSAHDVKWSTPMPKGYAA